MFVRQNRLLNGVSAVALAAIAAFGPSVPAFAQTTDKVPTEPAVGQPSAVQNPDSSENADIVVVAKGIRESLANAQAFKRAAPSVVEVIAPQDLGRFSDQSISDAFQRVPGVQIQRDDIANAGDRASIRGLGPAFITVTVNGRTPVSYGSEGISNLRSFNLDSVPTEVISGVVVFKSPTSDLVESGPAGEIDLRTLRPLDYKGKSVSSFFGTVTGSLQSDSQASGNGPRLSGVVGAKLFNNTLGLYFGGVVSNQNTRTDARTSAPVYTNLRVRNAVGGIDVIPDVLFPTAGGNVIPTNVKRYAFSAGAQWRPSSQLEVNVDYTYDQYDRRAVRFGGTYNLGGANGSLRSAVFEPGSYRIENGTLTFIDLGLVTPPSDGGNPNNILPSFASNSFVFNNFSKTQQGGINAVWKGDGVTIKLDVSRSELDNKQLLQSTGGNTHFLPTRQGFTLDASDSRNPIITVPSTTNLFNAQGYSLTSTTTRVFQNKSSNTAYRGDVDYEIANGIHLAAGARYATQIVDTRAGNRGLTVPAGSVPAALNALYTGQILATAAGTGLGFSAFPARDVRPFFAAFPSLILPGDTSARPFTGNIQDANDPAAALPLDATNTYRVRERTLALYGQLNFKGDAFSTGFAGNIGVRAVRTQETATAFQGVRTIDQSNNQQISSTVAPVTESNSYWTILPTANVSVFATDRLTLRFGVAKTIARPEFEALAPTNAVTISDPTRPLYNPSINNTARLGNVNLEPQTSWNYDVTAEYYPSWGGALYASAFYKDVSNFVFTGLFRNQTIAGYTGLFDVTQRVNAASGTAKGFEVGFNQPFTFLPGVLRNFGAQANYTFVDSSFDSSNILLQSGFPGASKHNANGVIYYQDDKFETRLSYSYRGDYLAALGNGQDRNQLPTFTRPIGTLDATVGYKLTPNFEVIVSARNLTKSDRYDYIYNTTTFREHDTRSRIFTFAIRASL